VVSADVLSHENDYHLPLRWIGAMAGQTACRLAGTTGVHSHETAIRFLLAGASAVQVASLLYKNGPEAITEMNSGIETWMESKGYHSIEDFRAKLSLIKTENATAWERMQFMKHFGGKEY
jgi:dihydroorotate dehydrogenase (fumarate)